MSAVKHEPFTPVPVANILPCILLSNSIWLISSFCLLSCFYLFDHLSSSLDDDGLGFFDGRGDLVVVAQQAKDRVLVPVPTHTHTWRYGLNRQSLVDSFNTAGYDNNSVFSHTGADIFPPGLPNLFPHSSSCIRF